MADEFGTDLSDIQTNDNGDVRTISGLANYRQALINRWITTPGEFLARPTYGAGVARYRDAKMTLANQKQLAKDIEEQTLLDPRTEKVLAVQISIRDDNAGLAQIFIKVKPIGHEALGITYSPFSGEA